MREWRADEVAARQADPTLGPTKRENTWQALQREALYFLTERSPTTEEVLRGGFDEHTATIGPVLPEKKKCTHMECDSTEMVRITRLGSNYLMRG
jgi:hypothetical protein